MEITRAVCIYLFWAGIYVKRSLHPGAAGAEGPAADREASGEDADLELARAIAASMGSDGAWQGAAAHADSGVVVLRDPGPEPAKGPGALAPKPL